MRNIIKQVLKEEIDSKSERIKSMVNRFGFDQAIEMIVGGKDTIRNAYQDNPKSFLNQFNNLTPIEKEDKIIYVDKNGYALFYYLTNEKDGFININYNRIWVFFERVIGLEFMEIQNLIIEWLEEVYGITGLIPDNRILLGQFNWKRPII
jgi:hypothetical protein